MRVRVEGGTVDHGQPPLCSSCRSSVIIKGPRQRDEIVVCAVRYPSRQIRFPVTSCSEYLHRAHPSLDQMEEIAWELRSNPNRRTVGFVGVGRFADGERHAREE
jgi:hypothetical protein